jgi:PKD repeat protein
MVQQLRVVLLVACLFLLPIAVATLGADIVVSTDGAAAYRSIQRAIDAASYGDVILVNPGMYEESLSLVSGITIRGAGSSHTVIRSSYGYQPVVKGISVGSVILENLSIERGSSILEATVVDLQSSQVTFRNCRIAGGQNGGVQSSGVSTLSFYECTIEDNPGYGLQIIGPSDVTLENCRVADNGLIGLLLRDATATIKATVFEWNDWDGIDLEGTSTLGCRSVTLSDNGRWGLRVSDSSRATFVDSTFHTQAFGNIAVDASATLLLESCQLQGGLTSSIEAKGTSSLQISRTQITGGSGDGIALQEQASLVLESSTIAHCGGTGLSLRTDGNCDVLRATVAYNSGHGLEFRGVSLSATHSIFALNDGIGLSVSASSGLEQSLTSDYNNVWGNRAGDYSGVHRSSSDISEAPEFANPDAGDFSLTLDSPCIGTGAFGSMVGATPNPRWIGQTQLEIGFAHTETEWGSLEATVGWTPSSNEPIGGRASWEYDWGAGYADLAITLSGLTRIVARGALVLSPATPWSLFGGSLAPEAGLRGIWDNAASRWEVWANAIVTGGPTAAQILVSYEGPTGLTRQDFSLTLWAFSLSGSARNLTLTQLIAGWTADLSFVAPSSTMGFEFRLVPDLRLSLISQWPLGDGSFQIEAQSYLEQLTSASFSISWRDNTSTQFSVALQLRSGQFEDGEVRVNLRLASLEIGGSLGANSETGPRCRLELLLRTSRWFLPRLNQPPMPAFSVAPLEPEAGEMIEFDASDSQDADGALDQIWWDFGDGGAAIGPIVQHRFSSPGEHTITLTVSDTDGAVTVLVGSIVVAESRTTPVAAFTWAPVSEGGTRLQRALRAGDYILLDAVDSQDPNGAIVEYGWDIQSDGVFEWTTSEPRWVIDPMTAGTWPVTLRVVDNDGYSDAIMHVLSIEELKPPIADFELSPSIPAVGDPIRFVDRSTAWDGTLLSWEWNFGDGHTSREREPVYRYDETGTYDVQLTVRDSEGLHATITVPVTIELNPELISIQQTWALVIGISDYSEVEDLSYARRDAEAIATWLLDANVPGDHVRLLTDNTPSEGTAIAVDTRLATLVNVREGLGWLRQMADQDDLVVIHFSGHGYQGADDNMDERDGVDEFFVLHDTRASAKDDTALRDDEFGRFLDRIESQHVLVFFDSCYSGGLSRSLAPGSRATGDVVDVFSDFKLEGRLILSASAENQDAFESSQLEHGVLTHFLLNGLDGAADLNADGHITVWELYEYVRSEVPPFVQQERGEKQFPQLIGEGESRIVLTRASLAEPPAFSYCPAIPFAGGLTRFRAEAGVQSDSLPLVWDFGFGSSDMGQEVVHRYQEAGTYTVELAVQGDDTLGQSTTQTIVLADWPIVMGRDEDAESVVISVGRQHGIAIGTRFSLADDSRSSEDATSGYRTEVLEVIELIDEDMAACTVLDQEAQLSVGSRLLQLQGAEGTPCWTIP